MAGGGGHHEPQGPTSRLARPDDAEVGAAGGLQPGGPQTGAVPSTGVSRGGRGRWALGAEGRATAGLKAEGAGQRDRSPTWARDLGGEKGEGPRSKEESRGQAGRETWAAGSEGRGRERGNQV